MKILLLHNKYNVPGGEDTVFNLEDALLKSMGHNVLAMEEENNLIYKSGPIKKLLIGISSIFNFKSLNKYKKILKEFKPDIVHVHNFYAIISPSIFWAARSMKIPIVITLHNFRLICPNALLFRDGKVCEKCINTNFKINSLKYRCYRGSLLQTLLIWIMTTFNSFIGTWNRKVTGYIYLTKFSKKIYMHSSMKVKEERFYYKPNFVYDPGEPELKREDYFLFVGRLSEEKGIKVLLESLAHIDNSKKIFVVGKGPLQNEVEAANNKYKNFTYLGFKTQKECVDLLRYSNAMLFPSIWYEGFPMTILEAFSAGTPVISSNIGNQGSIIKNGITGLHFESGDSKSLASVINKFDRKKNQSLYKNCRNEYLDNYTPEKNYEMLMNIYKHVIRNNND